MNKNFSSPCILYVILSIIALSNVNDVNAKNEISQNRQNYQIYVDENGVMRRTDSQEEVSYYGTNYTVPFAHAYRALNHLGVDHKEAIDRDIYHFKRLGFNGFRLHLWDVEITDSAGNLLDNPHLDLLDYLIDRLEDNGIDIVLTAQTNFGNGYPEKNINTGGFSYDFGKCEIHDNLKAQAIQENYLRQLVDHRNPYNNRKYSDDKGIIAIEINNEPCHSGSAEEVTAYINRMANAIREEGFDRPVLYNVSHNPEVTGAYYQADIDGTTYQWYPTGLVAGHERKGNFLPNVDEYVIPWKESMPNFDKMAKVVYEFDPGDILYSYMYPAIVRSFRKEGFQWITQFAYDPTDMARFNTEYQTHFLNLAYTPSKALSMLIAGEAARNIPRNTDFGKLPQDTVFGDFTVSYRQDLSLYNSPEKFYYSNSTSEEPKSFSALQHIAGRGNSKLVDYEGNGAYFLDRDSREGLWRLEVMPDIVIISDPFEKPSLDKEIGKTIYKEREMKLNIPGLNENFYFAAINENNPDAGQIRNAEGKTMDIYPGVYLLSSTKSELEKELPLALEDKALANFVAPKPEKVENIVIHQPKSYIYGDEDLEIKAEIIGTTDPLNVYIYPSSVSFWNENNTIIPMEKSKGLTYSAFIPKELIGKEGVFSYNIIVTEDQGDITFPQGIPGNPLDWDFTDYRYYTSKIKKPDAPISLLKPMKNDKNIDIAMIPEAWNFHFRNNDDIPTSTSLYELSTKPHNDSQVVIRRYIGDEIEALRERENPEYILIRTIEDRISAPAEIALVSKNGATYSALLEPKYKTGINVKLHDDYADRSTVYKVPITELKQRPTLIVPVPYPSFMAREVSLEPMDFNPIESDFVELIVPAAKNEETKISIAGIWIE